MADIYLLAGLTLPRGATHESLPATVTLFMSDCWQGMSRTQMRAREKKRGLRLSFCATAPCAPGDTGVFELRFTGGEVECLMLARATTGEKGTREWPTLQRAAHASSGARSAASHAVLT